MRSTVRRRGPVILLLLASVIARKRRGAVVGVLVICTVWLVSACKPSNQSSHSRSTEASRPRTTVSFPIQTCTFETFVPREKVSESARALMSAMGTGILNQEGGSLVRLQCPQGESFPGWIDSGGSLVSALYGLEWSMMSPSHFPGSSKPLQIWESEGERWVSANGIFEDRAAEARSSKSTSAVYTIVSGASLSEHSRRLLDHFGIGIAGESSTVIVKLGDFSGTGEVDADGRLRIIDENTWRAASK